MQIESFMEQSIGHSVTGNWKNKRSLLTFEQAIVDRTVFSPFFFIQFLT
jgi:hypothetical protein